MKVGDIMTKTPVTVSAASLAAEEKLVGIISTAGIADMQKRAMNACGIYSVKMQKQR